MDGSQFDKMTRQFAFSTSRRAMLKGLLGLGGSALAGAVVAGETDARRSSSSSSTTTTAAPVSSCSGVACGGGCCGSGQACCGQACCDGLCTVGGACCPAGNTVCGADCCSPEQQCCGGECCPGVCYGEELCCPAPRIFNEVGWVCCREGERPCGSGCIPVDACCEDSECAEFSIPCNTGRCSGPGGACYADPVDDRSTWEPGVSVCIGGEICQLRTCDGVCGFSVDDGCQGTISCCGCDGESGCTANGDCCSGVCVNGTCQSAKSPIGGPCDDPQDCSAGVCYQAECCQPRTGCEPDECGTVGDGCGSTLACPLCSGEACLNDSECLTGSCNNSVCADPVPTGGACDSVDDCSSQTATCEGGYCREPVGGSCQNTSDCTGDLVCQGAVCKVPQDGGCTEDGDCVDGLYCPSGTCTPRPKQLNESCEADGECANGLICFCTSFESNVCLPEDPTCVVEQRCTNGLCKVPVDGACQQDSDCPADYYCPAGTCTYDFRGPGEACNVTEQCETGLVCTCPNPTGSNGFCETGGTCKTVVFFASPCGGESQICVEGLFCDPIGEACKVPPGGACQTDGNDFECQVGYVCSGNRCIVGLQTGAVCTDASQCLGNMLCNQQDGATAKSCCVQKSQACRTDDDCCDNTIIFGDLVCRGGVCTGLGQTNEGDPCASNDVCKAGLECLDPSGLGSVCTSVKKRGQECDSRDICESGTVCYNCSGYSGNPPARVCADATNPCCFSDFDGVNNGCPGVTVQDPAGSRFVPGLCCNYACKHPRDYENCGGCGVSCVEPDFAPACWQPGTGRCSLVGEYPACVFDSVCASDERCLPGVAENCNDVFSCQDWENITCFPEITIPGACPAAGLKERGCSCASSSECASGVCSSPCSGSGTLFCNSPAVCT